MSGLRHDKSGVLSVDGADKERNVAQSGSAFMDNTDRMVFYRAISAGAYAKVCENRTCRDCGGYIWDLLISNGAFFSGKSAACVLQEQSDFAGAAHDKAMKWNFPWNLWKMSIIVAK